MHHHRQVRRLQIQQRPRTAKPQNEDEQLRLQAEMLLLQLPHLQYLDQVRRHQSVILRLRLPQHPEVLKGWEASDEVEAHPRRQPQGGLGTKFEVSAIVALHLTWRPVTKFQSPAHGTNVLRCAITSTPMILNSTLLKILHRL